MSPNLDYEENISEEMKIFEELLKKEGLRTTAQRILVAKTIFNIHTHFTADGLLDMLKDRRDEISKATIYRILGIMVEGKLLIEHDFGKDYKYYEHIVGHEHHDHIICVDCNRIVEFLNDKIENLQTEIADHNGFQILNHRLIIHGKCKEAPTCQHFKR
jgi:Fur family transcriptional regulator, ferric uptake regulator